MTKTLKIAATAIVASIAFSAHSAQAGGFGWGGGNYSSGLVNVSPDVNVGDVNALNGINVLNGNKTSILSGSLNGNSVLNGNSILGGNRYSIKKRSHRSRH